MTKILLLLLTMLIIFDVKYVNSLKEREHKIMLNYASDLEVIEDYKRMLDEFGELSCIYPENRALVVALAMTETSGRKGVIHPDKRYKGISATDTTLHKIKNDPDTLMAIEENIERIQQEHPGISVYDTIKAYKGARKNLKSTNVTYNYYQMLNRIFVPLKQK